MSRHLQHGGIKAVKENTVSLTAGEDKVAFCYHVHATGVTSFVYLTIHQLVAPQPEMTNIMDHIYLICT